MNHHDDPKRAPHKAIWLPCWFFIIIFLVESASLAIARSVRRNVSNVQSFLCNLILETNFPNYRCSRLPIPIFMLVVVYYLSVGLAADDEVDVDGLGFSEIFRPPTFVSHLFGMSTPCLFISSRYFSNSALPMYFLPLSILFKVEGGTSNIPLRTVPL